METKKRWFVTETSKGLETLSAKKFRLKEILMFVILLFATQLFAQSKEEAEILKISKDIFHFEVAGKIDSLTNFLDDKLVVVGSNGMKRSKEVYIDDLRKGKPVHNKIDVQENSAIINGTTAIVIGKGIFDITTNGSQLTLHLSYMEVFVNENQSWKLIALYANRLPD